MQLPRLSTAKGSASGSSAAEPSWETQLPILWRLNTRFIGLVVVCAIVTAFLAYMVANIQVTETTLSRDEAVRYWGAAVIGALIVVVGMALVVSEVLRARRAAPAAAEATTGVAEAGRPMIPRSLGFEHVPGRLVALAAAISLTGVVVAFILGTRMWVGGLAFLLPWFPVVAAEARWKHVHHGIYAMFALLCLLQVLHMGEHSMQVGQLMVHQGDLAQSHGVIGQLDFELVHFVTDTTLWITLGLLVMIFKGRNKWLWVAFAAASLHQIEHFYLFWLYHAHNPLYAAGGFAGIMGEGGMIGSPLDRPYLHFTYNFIVVVPMLIALWDEARRVDLDSGAAART